MTGKLYSLEVQPNIPDALSRLEDLANDIYYSWERHVRGLFLRLDRELWEECGHNPKLFLRRVSQDRLEEVINDRIFMRDYNRTLANYDTYREVSLDASLAEQFDSGTDLVVYFCAEFGFHESLPIYSGGLGILAGDHCKAASDMGLPFVGVGILYRQGYFTQTIDGAGNQESHYLPHAFEDLPVSPAVNAAGDEIRVAVEMAGRKVMLRVWQLKAGRIRVYLLDSDLPDNSKADRAITYQLYGGDRDMRIQQEIVLGIGGVRALRSLGLEPTVWHINEGHSAFQILERCRALVADGLEFPAAIELVAANTVFTTHTPVSAGHDKFSHDMILHYFQDYTKDVGVTAENFLALGANEAAVEFNLTSLALRGSRHHNGVSRIHGGVTSELERYVWPQIPPPENPIGFVTNGVHTTTFLAHPWLSLFDMEFGPEWRNQLRNERFWNRVLSIPDTSYWSTRLSLKRLLMDEVRRNVRLRALRLGFSEARSKRQTAVLDSDKDVLIVGFGRRFATYKRATLLFHDAERLARLLNDPQRPVVLIFSGKAHPDDQPGQELIRVIYQYSERPEFVGRIMLLEGYDLALARKLVSGVDVWLNTPEYPLEACGTSGQKAGINGVANLSILDGWWPEGYDGSNGWAIPSHSYEPNAEARKRLEATEIFDVLEQEVVPKYFHDRQRGYPAEWIELSKNAMLTTIPRFNSSRMVMDYVDQYYVPARQAFVRLSGQGCQGAKQLAAWKSRVLAAWPGIKIRRIDDPRLSVKQGDTVSIQVAVRLNGLDAGDVIVECLIGKDSGEGDRSRIACYRLMPQAVEGSEQIYHTDLEAMVAGLQHYQIRLYPYHTLLSHPFEVGRMLWL